MSKIDASWAYLSAFGGLVVGVSVWPNIWGPQWEILPQTTALLFAAIAVMVWQASE